MDERGGGAVRSMDADRWDRAAARALARPYLDPQVAAAKRRAHLDLLQRWLPDLGDSVVLKTDLWEEGVAGDELLFSLASRARAAYGLDISPAVVSAANERVGMPAGLRLLCADVRDIPLPSGAVDAVVSTSTLDHLQSHEQRTAAVAEIDRVLAPDGTLVITVDNADNVGDPLLRLANMLGAVPFPLGPAMSLTGLRDLVSAAGFTASEHAYVVHAPRVVATIAVRALRRLSGSDRALEKLLRSFEALGRRAPRRLGCFVAVKAVKPAPPGSPRAGTGR
jgi:SAM-dependent methyltransferase